ncbi:MAG: tRNA epoxyqueuosine(34) reductase QueG [Deltaproteobacteria bacterium]|nr:tRNA epoxyqueuosine(34) reductase QueG [Deltaproteobacteria bacterium]
MSPEGLAEFILEVSRRLGFHRVGIVPVEPAARHHLYRAWLDAGHAGEMEYLGRTAEAEARRDARALLPEAMTIVVVALSYGAPDPLMPPNGPRGHIARYARGEDYHAVFKRKLWTLADEVARAVGNPVAARPCVDTAPLLERDEAERAGIGFVAKNTMLIAPGLGSYVLLGELLLAAHVTPTARAPERKRCGSCRSCLDACPTGAFVDEFVLDARRCISYLTIELRGPIPRDLREHVGTRIFGCDVCQEACPFNTAVSSGRGPAPAPELSAPSPERAAPELSALIGLGASQFRKLVEHTALRRVRREQLLRNACVALGNTGDPSAVPALRGALTDRHPLVRAHAAWALGRLGDSATLSKRLTEEADPTVREEIEQALQTLIGPSGSARA